MVYDHNKAFTRLDLKVAKKESLNLAFIALFLAYILFTMSFNLSSFPGLHGDEAWVGLNAAEILEHGLKTIHGMNRYTGSFHSWLVSLIFEFKGINVINLRFPGILLNFISLLIIAIGLNKYIDNKSILLFLAIFISCSTLLIYSRVAWEVCAFQGFFIAIKFYIILKYFSSNKISLLDLCVFFTVTILGTINHFIFISESFGMLLSTVIVSLLLPSESIISLLFLSTLNFALVILTCLIKSTITADIFNYYKYGLFVSVTVIIYSLAFLYNKNQASLSISLINFIKKSQKIKHIVSFSVASFFMWLLIKFLYFHLWSSFGTISGLVVIQRLTSYQFSSFEFWFIQIIWLVILTFFILCFIKRIIKFRSSTDLFYFMYCLCTMLCLSAFLPGNSDRYYLIPSYLFVFTYPVIVKLEKNISLLSIVVLSSLIFSISLEQSILWKAILSPENPKPMVVNYHNYQDLSHHFVKIDSLLYVFKNQGICELDEKTSYFIKKPLEFYFLSQPFKCDKNLVRTIEYCDTCQQPPKYFKIF